MTDNPPDTARAPAGVPRGVPPATPTGPDEDQCPECNSTQFDVDSARGETTCRDCGLVLSEDEIDHGPEWRSFTPGETKQRKRVGSPRTNTLHDFGLSTMIGYRDGYGNKLNAKKTRQFQRLRRHNSIAQTGPKQERNLRFALGELHRMSSALGLPKSTKEIAATIHRRAVDEDLLRGRSIEQMATGALYAACKIAGTPRSGSQMKTVMRTPSGDGQSFESAYRLLNRELNLQIPILTPRDHLNPILTSLNMEGATDNPSSDTVQQLHRTTSEILSVFEATPATYISGNKPAGITAAAIYLAGQRTPGVALTQARIADAADVSEVTIRSHARRFPDAYADAIETNPSLADRIPRPPSAEVVTT